MSFGRYLVTGGAGFIGSHLAEALLARGNFVSAIDDLSTGSLANIEHLFKNPAFHFARASITDALVLDRMASEADVVIHLAAAVGVSLIVEHPVHTLETNVMGTEAVLKAAMRYRCRVLLASTSEVYGKGSKVPFAEEDDILLGATSKSRWGYACSKMADEFLGQYGMVVPRLVGQALLGRPLSVYGDGNQSRCFCHVADVVEAIVALSEHPGSPGRVFNIGSTEEITIADLARRVNALTGNPAGHTLVPYSEAYAPGFEDMQRRVPDISRIGALCGWKPVKTLDEILASVIAHERSKLSG